jgi:hypothetical protein
MSSGVKAKLANLEGPEWFVKEEEGALPNEQAK